MVNKIKRILKGKKKKSIDIDEIFLDSSNIPNYDKDQFEGRIEKPISPKAIFTLGGLSMLIVFVFILRLFSLQVVKGSEYKEISENNRLRHDVIFAYRGVINDRNGVTLAWNEFESEREFPKRVYTDMFGFGHLLGYIKYPKKDKSGFYYTLDTEGQDGIEKHFNTLLKGKNGMKLTEVDVKGSTHSESEVVFPEHGGELNLSIDSDIQHKLASLLKTAVSESDFKGGAGVIMDTKTGEIIALTSVPEYDPNIMTEGKDVEVISGYFKNSKNPFLDRVISGLFIPGSIVKPFVALAALNEKIISEHKEIYSAGSISIPNPYDPSKPTIFKDWKAHGYTAVREAISVSSDVYFYAIGGGFQDQKGLGIVKIDEYLKKFMFAVPTEGFFKGPEGNIPTPEWKEKTFEEKWLLGNTYHTAIGQYGFLVTPLQMIRSLTGIINEGVIVEPTIIKDEQGNTHNISGIEPYFYKVVKEGMKEAALTGTAKALNIGGFTIAGKTGTAEIGTVKGRVNSWVEGFFPYEEPRYAFVIVLENGPNAYKIGAPATMANLLLWMREHKKEYLNPKPLE